MPLSKAARPDQPTVPGRGAGPGIEVCGPSKRYVTSVPPRSVLLEWAERSAAFDRPVLIVWAAEDRMMPRRHGRRLAGLFPHARLIEIDDSYTLLPEDRPGQLIRAIRGFVPAPRRNTPLPDNAPVAPAPQADRGR